MAIPEVELATADRLKSFVDHSASDFINGAGKICEVANNYHKLDITERDQLFRDCKAHLFLINKIGKILQDALDE